MLNLEIATEEFSSKLSKLAYCSEAYWGYDKKYMDKFSKHYNVTKKFIRKNPSYIMKSDDQIIGFFGLQESEQNWQLEFFYVVVECIGKGYGRKLWDGLLDICKEKHINKFEFATSPQAVPFYKKMGAQVVGNEISLLQEDRVIPKLSYSMT